MSIFREDYVYEEFDLNEFQKSIGNVNIDLKITELIDEIEYMEDVYMEMYYHGISKTAIDSYAITLERKYIQLHKYETLKSSL